ncbi:DUF58 domain-containing protein [Verrucomicrobiales bacterium BCK34]|nr:DUF58 domain-containing protein [Verrucomicrobiales bacterium BCK34]
MDNQRPTLTQRPAGICAVIGAGLLILSGLGTFSILLLSTGLLTAFIWGLCRFLASRSLRGLDLTRTLPRRGVAGESFPVKVTLSNQDPRLPLPEFTFHDPLSESAIDEKSTLQPGQTRPLQYTGKRSRRGGISKQYWRATSTWPLGFFESEKTAAFTDTQRLLVIPKPFLPPHLKRYIENLQDDFSLPSFAPPDPSAEFKYLREFRHGDSLKSIHWPASIRSDELLIREPEPPSPRPRRFGILVHSFSPSGKIETPETFEMILRIVAGLLFHFRSLDVEVHYQILPGRQMRLDDKAGFSKAIDQLALQSRHPLTSPESLLAAVPSFRNCDDLFVISDCPLAEWEPILTATGLPLTCLDSVSLSSTSQPKLRTRRQLRTRCRPSIQ